MMQGPDEAEDNQAKAHTDEASNRPLNVLLVGLNQTVAAASQEVLVEHFGPETSVDIVTPQDLPDLSEHAIVLLHAGDGDDLLSLLEQILNKRADLPVVLVSDDQGRDQAIEGIRRGAYDNVVTVGNYLATLPLVIEKNLAIWQTRRENELLQAELAKSVEEIQIKNKQLEGAVSQLETVASTDPLTGLHNRRSFDKALEQSYAQAERYNHDLTFLMIDIDNFKLINDNFGHQTGDEVLQLASKILVANCRRADVAGRFGGDEFVILLPETNMVTAFKVAKRIRAEFDAALKSKLSDTDSAPKVSMSIGAASIRQCKPTSSEEMVSFADQALYTAKQSDKTPIVAYAKQVAIKIGASTPQDQGTSRDSDF